MCDECFYGQLKNLLQSVCLCCDVITVASWKCLAAGNDGYAVARVIRICVCDSVSVCACACMPWQWSWLLGPFESHFLKRHDFVWLRGRSWALPADWVADLWISAAAGPSNTDWQTNWQSHGAFIINILTVNEALLALNTKNVLQKIQKTYIKALFNAVDTKCIECWNDKLINC